MFAYNELSDLINGELVTPLRKDGENITCLNSNGEEVVYSFDDFDFDKTLEERSFIVEDSNDDSSEENTPSKESKEYSFDSKDDPHWLDIGDAELIAQQFGYEPSTPRTKIKAIKEFDLEVNI
jgi:hypothetical protein